MRLRLIGPLAVLALLAVGCGGAVPEASGPGEGIQVHGDWTLDIYNEDGSLDQHVEFSNALLPGGASTIASIVSGNASIGSWAIRLQGPGFSVLSDVLAATYTVPDGFFTLSGSVVVDQDSQINHVETRSGKCNPSVAPADCNLPVTSTPFTAKTISPVDVTAGQTVQVEVEISFTSG